MQEMSWKNKLINLKFDLVIISILLLFSCTKNKTDIVYEEEKPVIYVTNWLELPEKMKAINDEFIKANPDINVKYLEFANTDYDNQMQYHLKAGIAPDIIYLRSYDAGKKVFDTGYLQVLNDIIPELSSFAEAPLKAWSTDSNDVYAVPSLGVVHGVYYNKSIFSKYNLSPPNTWEDLFKLCQVLKRNKENVFAFGTKDNWLLYEVLFSGFGPNFYGGEDARQRILNKELFMKDEVFINTFHKLESLVPYFPKNYRDLGYEDIRLMFAQEKAAMYIGGSWDITTIKDSSENPENFGFFAPPVEKEGDKLNYCFHVDIGVAMNRVTRYPEAAKKYIKWVASKEYAKLVMEQFPGFFSYTPGNYQLNDNLAREMESYISGSIPTVRTLWENLSTESPTGNELLGVAMKGVLNSNMTPEKAAEYVHSGISWYYK